MYRLHGHIENGVDLDVIKFLRLLMPLLIPTYNPDAFLFLFSFFKSPLINGELM